MLKNLFRLIAGGQVQPKITFICSGINSDLVVVTNIRTLPRTVLVDLLTVPGVRSPIAAGYAGRLPPQGIRSAFHAFITSYYARRWREFSHD